MLAPLFCLCQGNFTYVPFYHKARNSPTSEDITVVLQSSHDRLGRAVNIARIWDGPMSVVLFVRYGAQFIRSPGSLCGP